MQVTEFLKKLKDLNSNQLVQKNGIGQVIIDSLTFFLQSERFYNISKGFEELENQGIGVNLILKQSNSLTSSNLISNQNLSGIVIVITGVMSIPRNQLKEKLEQIGVKVAGSVTKKTNFLLAGQNSGSKLKAATELGIPIIEMDNWLDFEQYLETHSKINPS